MIFKRRSGESLPMDRVIPRPSVASETDASGRVILLKPKFRQPWLARLIGPFLKHPCFHIRLDELGSAAWKKLDGHRNALEIARELERELGDQIKPVYERFGRFLALLKHNHFIEY